MLKENLLQQTRVNSFAKNNNRNDLSHSNVHWKSYQGTASTFWWYIYIRILG